MSNKDEFLCCFGRRVALVRKSRSLTQRELAAQAGISAAYIAAIESGRRWPRLAVHYSIAGALNVQPGMLLAGATPEQHISSRKIVGRERLSP